MNKTTPPTVKLRLNEILAERALTADDVAELCEQAGAQVSRVTIYNALSRKAKGIHLATLTALCRGLNIQPGDLFVIK